MWVAAICSRAMDALRPEELREGIGARLQTVTDFFDLDEPEDPDEVFSRLTVLLSKLESSCWVVTYHPEHPPVMMDQSRGPKCAATQQEELAERAIRHKRGKTAQRIRTLLSQAEEEFTFCLKVSHLETMGFPITIAAAAFRGGLIRSCSTSWMEPRGLGVRILLEYEE